MGSATKRPSKRDLRGICVAAAFSMQMPDRTEAEHCHLDRLLEKRFTVEEGVWSRKKLRKMKKKQKKDKTQIYLYKDCVL